MFVMYYRAYINFCIEWYVKNSKKNNNNNNNNFFFAVHSVLVTIYLIIKCFGSACAFLPYFSCDLFVLPGFKGKMIYVSLSEAN